MAGEAGNRFNDIADAFSAEFFDTSVCRFKRDAGATYWRAVDQAVGCLACLRMAKLGHRVYEARAMASCAADCLLKECGYRYQCTSICASFQCLALRLHRLCQRILVLGALPVRSKSMRCSSSSEARGVYLGDDVTAPGGRSCSASPLVVVHWPLRLVLSAIGYSTAPLWAVPTLHTAHCC